MALSTNEQYQQLEPAGQLAMLGGQIRIIDAMDQLPRKTITERITRFHYGVDENAKLLEHLEKLYPQYDDNPTF